jgi:aminopeptidase-like protein
VLNLSDGRADLIDIAARAQLDFPSVRAAATLLLEHGLLAAADATPERPT